jgi:putative FmdB family regulatory protein
MPTYVYGLYPESKAEGCTHCREHFEAVQRMSEDALKACPKCGAPIIRCIQPPMVGSQALSKGPSEKRIKEAGFTQFKRKGKGYYEKTFGKGPSALHP